MITYRSDYSTGQILSRLFYVILISIFKQVHEDSLLRCNYPIQKAQICIYATGAPSACAFHPPGAPQVDIAPIALAQGGIQ